MKQNMSACSYKLVSGEKVLLLYPYSAHCAKKTI